MNQPTEEERPISLGDLCMQLVDGIVHVEVENPVVRQIYRQFRPHIARTIEERLPLSCRDSDR